MTQLQAALGSPEGAPEKMAKGKVAETMSVPDAGLLYYGLSRNGSYDAAARGDIPTIRVGRLLRVPIAAMERRLRETGAPKAMNTN